MYDKKHRIRNSYILISLLAGVCWILALTAILFQLSDTSANAGSAVPAYSSHSPVYSNTNFRLNAVSEHTYELTPKDSVKTNNKLNNSDAFCIGIACIGSDSYFQPFPEGSQVRSYFATLLHDPSLQLVSSHIETNYADYYLYSTKLNKLGFPASSFGQNLHIAVTKNGHIYLASPQIDYDF